MILVNDLEKFKSNDSIKYETVRHCLVLEKYLVSKFSTKSIKVYYHLVLELLS